MHIHKLMQDANYGFLGTDQNLWLGGGVFSREGGITDTFALKSNFLRK